MLRSEPFIVLLYLFLISHITVAQNHSSEENSSEDYPDLFESYNYTFPEKPDIERVIEPAQRCPLNFSAIDKTDNSTNVCILEELYDPSTDKCYKAYSRGPCEPGMYFILSSNGTAAECAVNPCQEGSVMYENACHEFCVVGSPCGVYQFLAVRRSDFAVICEYLIMPRTVLGAARRSCPGKSKLGPNGRCRAIVN